MTSLPPFIPYPSISNTASVLNKIRDGTCAVAVPKLHGSNIQFTVWRVDGSTIQVRAGRRNGYIEPGADHFGHGLAVAAQGIQEGLERLYARMTSPLESQVMRVYGEVYGGVYTHPDVPAQSHGRKPVQRHINYSPNIRLAFFDICMSPSDAKDTDVDRHTWLSFDDASDVCRRVGLPWVPPAFRGSIDETVAWARAHSADNALAYWNPEGLPLLEMNAGEGFVVRTVGETQVTAKIKNPRFEEIAISGQGGEDGGPTVVDTAQMDASTALRLAGNEFAHRYILASRAASVASKLPSEDLDNALSKTGKSILNSLALALLTDALEDARKLSDPIVSSIGPGTIGFQTARSAAFATMVEFLKSR